MIPDEAVEAAALIIAQESLVNAAMDGYGWDAENDSPEPFMTHARERARRYLEVAAPYMLAEAANLVSELVDPDDCWFDHHGGCQAHGYLSLQPGETCPQHDAKEFVRTSGGQS